jgi:murein DD-endopeptidase MepM/ murein hydrolase activator NlpD
MLPVPPPSRPYDREAETPAKGALGARHRPPAWDWSLDVDGALALSPEPDDRLNADATSDSVSRMALPEAPGLTVRAAFREEERAKTRRARRIAALVGVATVAFVVLLLTAFGSNGPLVGANVPAPAQRLLPSRPPRPQILATYESLRVQLPINQARVTAIGYHASGRTALALEPIGSQANAGVFGRIVQRLIGDDGSGISYYLLEGGAGPRTGGLDVGAPVGTDVYAPVDGTVIAISDRVVNGRPYGKVVEIQPSDNPGVVAALSNVAMDPALTVGRTVVAARTKIGRVIDLSPVEHAALARYTQDKGQHVHVELHAAASLAAP